MAAVPLWQSLYPKVACFDFEKYENAENDLASESLAENSEARARAGLFHNPSRPLRRARQQAGKQSGVKTTPAPVQPPPVKKPVDYNRFTHQTHLGGDQSPEHQLRAQTEMRVVPRTAQRDSEISNNIVPTTDRNKQLKLKFPGHKACIECHVVQFTSKPQQTCVICHNTQQGLIARPPQRDFPQRYDFNVFRRGKHELHVTYKLSDGKQMELHLLQTDPEDPSPLPYPRSLMLQMPSPGSFDEKAKVKGNCVVCHTQ